MGSELPETALEKIVATAWHEAMLVPPADIDEDFFAAGGHSLLASDVAARLDDILGVRVPLTMVFDHPTVRAQAAWLAGKLARHPPDRPSAPAPTHVLVRIARDAPDDARTIDLGALRGTARRAAWHRALETPGVVVGRGVRPDRCAIATVVDARTADARTARAIADGGTLPASAPQATVDEVLGELPPWRTAAISPARARALLEAGRQRFATTETTLVAAIAIALARELGTDRVVLGVLASLRDDRDALGAYTAIAPVVIELGGAPSFATIVERVQTATLRAWAAAAGLVATAREGDAPPLDAIVEVRAYGEQRIPARDVLHVIATPAASGATTIRACGAFDVDALDAQLDALVAAPDLPLAFGAEATAAPLATLTGESPPLPLTHAQERLWFLEQLTPGTTLNNLQRAYRLDGAIELPLLERALLALAARQDALRTRFVRAEDGTPRQIVVRDARIDHAVDDEPLGNRTIESVAREEYGKIFDLERAPLWRTRVVRGRAKTHFLVLTIHHLIADALSMLLWLRELAELYHSLAAHTAPHLPRLGASVAELAAWERSDAGRAQIANDLAFWVERLAGATPMALPLDYRRPPVQHLGRHEIHELLPPDKAAELRALARFHGATINVALLAAAFAFLARITDRDDLVGIVPSARRDAPGRAAVIGLLLNLLPLRLRLDGDPSFHEIIARTNRELRAAIAHAEAPFERVVGALGLAREPGRQPLFDVILNMVPGTERFKKGDLKFDLAYVMGSMQPCDMVIGAATRKGGSLDLVVRCRDDLFTSTTARRNVRRLLALITGAIAAPETRLSELPLLPDEERELSLVTWNATATPLPEATVHELVVARLRERPDAIATVQGDRTCSARELDERSARVARHLVARGLAPGTPIGVALPPSPELAIAALGVMRAGCIYVPLDTSQPAARFEQLAAEVAIRLDSIDVPDAEAELPRVGPDDPSYTVFTSGSTGRPKHVVTTHRALVNQLVWFANALPWQPGEVACLRSSPAFVDSLWELFGALADGIPLAIASHEDMADPRKLVAMAARHRVTRMVVVPSLLHTILQLGAELPDLALFLATSEELKPSLVKTFFARRPTSRLVNLYGASETADQTAAFEVRAPDPARTPIGTPIANSRLYVVDPTGRPAAIGVPGELCIAGVGVSEAYLSPAPNPHLGERVYRTGDRGRWRHDGVLEYLGRLDHVVKVRGIRVDPAEIERALLEHPRVSATVVVTRPGFDGEARLVAYFVGTARFGELRRHLRARLPETLIPTSFVPLQALPLGVTGKVDRAALPEPARAAAGATRAPRGAIELAVADAWEQLLGRPSGAEDDFFAAGGQSLIAAQLGQRLTERFAVDIPLQVMFEHPTIAAQATWIERATRLADTTTAITPIAAGESVPLGFAQERMWFAAELATGAPAPKIRLALRIEGPLEVPRLEHALDAVALRHGALRTIFETHGGEVRQRVVAALPREHRVVELASEAELHDLIGAERTRPFELAVGPPWRTQLARLAPDHHILHITTHHLVTDGLSSQILLDELDAFYTGRELPALATSTIDAVAWQRRMVDAPEWAAARTFWRAQLAGATPIELPLVAPRTAWSSGASGIVRGELDRATAQAIAAAARAADTSTFAALLSAVAQLFAELTGRRDLTIGTIAAGRDRPELRPLIGLFLNPLPLRVDAGAELRATGAIVRAALAHGHLPFERIVADARPERRPYRQPLFDVVINHHPREQAMRLGDLKMSYVRGVGTPVAPYELMIRTIEHARGITVRLDYQLDRYAERDVVAWHARLLELARAIPTSPG